MPNRDFHPKIAIWSHERLNSEVTTSLHRLADADDVQQIAVMPDVHLAGDVCNGTVVATNELIYPFAVGADIGCGMLAVGFDLESSALSNGKSAGQILAGLYRRLPAIKHSRVNCLNELPDVLWKTPLSHASLEKFKHRDGLLQLGSLGRGNHFVEFQSDAEGRLWLMIHSGSRGMGQSITEHHLRLTVTGESGLGFLDAMTSAGQAYLSDANWAVEYAMQNRLAMARAVEALLHDQFNAVTDWSAMIHCHHNHLRRELHFGRSLWIHRKGALSAAECEPGVIPGSMGTKSYHVTGRGHDASLRSSSHGAGRLFARSVALQRISRREFERQMRGVWFDLRHAVRLRDEAPAAYKEIGAVMRAQRDLTRIERELVPVLVYKGG